MAMQFGIVLDRITQHIEQQGHHWAMAGGLAMQAHGLSRTTQDLDLVVDAAVQSELLAFMESLGYRTLHASAGFSNHLHADSSFGRVDFIYVDRETADQIFPAAATRAWEGRSLPVISAEHLIAMKVHAMKNDPSRTFGELADIQHLMRGAGMDRKRVRRYFESAGLLDRFDELLGLL